MSLQTNFIKIGPPIFVSVNCIIIGLNYPENSSPLVYREIPAKLSNNNLMGTTSKQTTKRVYKSGKMHKFLSFSSNYEVNLRAKKKILNLINTYKLSK